MGLSVKVPHSFLNNKSVSLLKIFISNAREWKIFEDRSIPVVWHSEVTIYWFPLTWPGTLLLKHPLFFMSYTTFLYTCTKFFYFSSLYFVCLSNQTLWLIQLHDLKCYFYTDEYPIYNSSPERSPELFYYFHLTTWHFQSTLKFNKSKTKFMVYTSIFFSFLWMAPLSIS